MFESNPLNMKTCHECLLPAKSIRQFQFRPELEPYVICEACLSTAPQRCTQCNCELTPENRAYGGPGNVERDPLTAFCDVCFDTTDASRFVIPCPKCGDPLEQSETNLFKLACSNPDCTLKASFESLCTH